MRFWIGWLDSIGWLVGNLLKMFILCRYGSTCIKYICVYHLPTKPPRKVQQHNTPQHNTPHLHNFSSATNLIQYLHHRVLRNSPQIPAPYLYPPSYLSRTSLSLITNGQIYMYVSVLRSLCATPVYHTRGSHCAR